MGPRSAGPRGKVKISLTIKQKHPLWLELVLSQTSLEAQKRDVSPTCCIYIVKQISVGAPTEFSQGRKFPGTEILIFPFP